MKKTSMKYFYWGQNVPMALECDNTEHGKNFRTFIWSHRALETHVILWKSFNSNIVANNVWNLIAFYYFSKLSPTHIFPQHSWAGLFQIFGWIWINCFNLQMPIPQELPNLAKRGNCSPQNWSLEGNGSPLLFLFDNIAEKWIDSF